jgi:hypothetical protein
MNRTIKETTVRRDYYNSHTQLEPHLDDFGSACNFGRRLKSLEGYEFICQCWTSLRMTCCSPLLVGTRGRHDAVIRSTNRNRSQ